MIGQQDYFLQGRLPTGLGGLYYGLYPAEVTDVADPDGQGRVRIRLSFCRDPEGSHCEAWARLATLMAGSGRGTWFIPETGDEVLVGFEAGDPARPYVLGSLWNGQDAAPESMDSQGDNKVRSITSKNGIKITLTDEDGAEKLTLETPGGQKLELKDGPGKVEVQDSNGNRLVMDSSGVQITTSAKATINASQMEINASMLTVNAGMSRFSGVVQADTVISTSVVGTSYTPGAGNIW